MAAKERTKENCRCFDAADPRLRGCTPLRTPKRKSEGAGAKRKQYYFSFLTPPPLPPLLSRVFPRTPDADNGCSSAGASPQKAPHQGSWPSLRGLKGSDGLCVTTHFRVTTRPLQKGRAAALPCPSRFARLPFITYARLSTASSHPQSPQTPWRYQDSPS